MPEIRANFFFGNILDLKVFVKVIIFFKRFTILVHSLLSCEVGFSTFFKKLVKIT